MIEKERMHKAIELTIDAGYLLDKDAFKFLSTMPETESPTELVKQALLEMQNLERKPLFIDRELLKRLIQKVDARRESPDQPSKEQFQVLPEPQMLEGKRFFRPSAKEIESELDVIQDPGDKLSSSGTIKDYLGYFRDRFERMEKILRRRIDVRNATSIVDALKSPPNTKLKIIAMVTNKRESGNKITLAVEDLHSTATVLVPQRASEHLIKATSSLLFDQIACFSVVKTRNNLLIAQDIILPDIAKKSHRKVHVPVYAVLTSDMHVGSTKFSKEAFNRFILWLNGRYGNRKMREMAGQVKYILIAGDIVDGIGIYPNQIKELAITEVYEQYKLAASFIEQIPDYIDVVVIPGNHDATRKALPQPAIPKDFLEPVSALRRIYSFGNPCLISLHGIEVLLHHGRSLEDLVSKVPGMTHAHPEKAMKLLLQSRHLAPIYGGKTPLSPENRDFLIIERIPDIYHAGHIHNLKYCNYRGVLLVNSGCWQEQTEYMQRHGIVPTPGRVPLINLQTWNMAILSFN